MWSSILFPLRLLPHLGTLLSLHGTFLRLLGTRLSHDGITALIIVSHVLFYLLFLPFPPPFSLYVPCEICPATAPVRFSEGFSSHPGREQKQRPVREILAKIIVQWS